MANPQNLTYSVRQYYTTLHDALGSVDKTLNLIVDLGGEAFFKPYLDAGNEDITWDEFQAAFLALQSMQNWIDTNNSDFAPMRLE